MKALVISNSESKALVNSEPALGIFLDSLRLFLESLDESLFEKGSKSSLTLKNQLGGFLQSWNSDLLIQRDFPARKFPSSHVHVEFQTEIAASLNGEKIQLTVEIFGDNRQAIASNLMKLELAGRNFLPLGKSLGIGITVAKDLKDQGWDGATASGEEYEFAMLHTYARFIEMPLLLIALNKD